MAGADVAVAPLRPASETAVGEAPDVAVVLAAGLAPPQDLPGRVEGLVRRVADTPGDGQGVGQEDGVRDTAEAGHASA